MRPKPDVNDYEIITVSEWLPDIRKHGRDCRWVDRNFDLLFEAITHGVSFEWFAQDAIEALNLIFDCVVQRDDYRRWEPLLFEALQHARELRDSDSQLLLLDKLGQNYLRYGMRKAAANAYDLAIQHADDAQSPEMMLRTRLGYLRTEAIYTRASFGSLAQEIVRLLRQVQDLDLMAQTHYSLALAYSFRHEVIPALGHGQTAYAIWHHLKNHARKADTAFTLAESYRMAELYDLSARLSQLGQRNLVGTDYAHKMASFAYQTGILYMTQKQDYAAAETWLQLALDKFAPLDFPYSTGAAHHALGLVQTELGKAAEALVNLKAARRIWRKLKNWHEIANVYSAVGYLAYKVGKEKQARRWYERTLRLALEHLEASPARDRLIEVTQQEIAKLTDRD